MSGCHVPLSDNIELEHIIYSLEKLTEVINKYLAQNNSTYIPYIICGHCNGIGRIVENGIL